MLQRHHRDAQASRHLAAVNNVPDGITKMVNRGTAATALRAAETATNATCLAPRIRWFGVGMIKLSLPTRVTYPGEGMIMTSVGCLRLASRTQTGAVRWLTAALMITTIWASPAAADDWAQPVVNLQQSLAPLGVSLGGGVTGFGQGMAAGRGSSGIPFGGKTDVLLGLDGAKLGLWPGLSVSVHLEQAFGQSANDRSDGAILPVNTALAFPTFGGTTTDLSLVVAQKLGDAVTISVGKFNMLDVAARTPLLGGGGEATFWNIGLAAPVSGVTPPYIAGGIASVKTAPATFTLMVYDPRNAEDLDVIEHPFSQGTTTSLSVMVPVTLFGVAGYHTLRGAYSTASGFNFDYVPQLLLPTGSQAAVTKQGYYFGSYSFQQFLWQDPNNPGRGWGLFGQISGSDANPNPIGNTIIFGVGGSTPGRPDDRWGVAWVDYLFSSQLRNTLVALGGGLKNEQLVEAYYDAAVFPHVRMGPDVQVIWPGTPGKPTTLFLGVRGRSRLLIKESIRMGSPHARRHT